jgi:putative transposase
MQKQHLTLAIEDRLELESLFNNRSLSVKIHQRIQVLLSLDAGKSYKEVGMQVGMTYVSLRAIIEKYLTRGVNGNAMSYLMDKPRSGRPIVISGEERAKITALACSQAPEGHIRWTLRLLADKVIELGICEHLSYVYAGEILKKMSYNRILNASGALEL